MILPKSETVSTDSTVDIGLATIEEGAVDEEPVRKQTVLGLSAVSKKYDR